MNSIGLLSLAAAAAGALWHVIRKQHARRSIVTVHKGQQLRSANEDSVSVVSFNVLADVYSKPQRHTYVNPRYLAWTHRSALIHEELAAISADIVCLQEVDSIRFEEYQSSSALQHHTAVVQKKSSDHPVVNVIFFRSNKFHLWWSEHRTRVMMLALTYIDSLGQTRLLYVVNVHLEGSPYRPNDRVNQVRNALQRMQQHQIDSGLNPADCSVIICGDFNSGKKDAVCQLLHRGILEGGYTEAHLPQVPVTKQTISHPYYLQDVYSGADDSILPFTRKVPQLASTIDFIWASCDLTVEALYSPLPRKDWGLVAQQSLPNKSYPSDHVPVGAVLAFPAYSMEVQQ